MPPCSTNVRCKSAFAMMEMTRMLLCTIQFERTIRNESTQSSALGACQLRSGSNPAIKIIMQSLLKCDSVHVPFSKIASKKKSTRLPPGGFFFATTLGSQRYLDCCAAALPRKLSESVWNRPTHHSSSSGDLDHQRSMHDEDLTRVELSDESDCSAGDLATCRRSGIHCIDENARTRHDRRNRSRRVGLHGQLGALRVTECH